MREVEKRLMRQSFTNYPGDKRAAYDRWGEDGVKGAGMAVIILDNHIHVFRRKIQACSVFSSS